MTPADATTPPSGSSAPNEPVCPLCGKTSPPGNRFCGNCGTKLPQTDARPSAAATAPASVALPSERTIVMRAGDPAEELPSPAGNAPAPPLPLNLPEDPIAREREKDRLLTLANVQRMRGQTKDALATLATVLALMEGAALPRERALVHEQIGDIYINQGNFEEAKRAYSRAKDEDPDRASIERKLGEAALRLSEVKMTAAGGSLDSGGTFDRAAAVRNSKRNAGTALLLSFFVPGLGQFANGQAVKGGLCLAVYVLTLLAMNLSPDGQAVYKQLIQIVSARPVPGANLPVSPLFWILLALAFAVWVYSLIDAAVTASQMRRDSDAGPYIDKSGWEV